MYAVIVNKNIVYLGSDKQRALGFYTEAAAIEKCFAEVNSLEELEVMLQPMVQAESLSEAASRVLDALHDAGFNKEDLRDMTRRIKANGEKAVAEVRSLGIKGMKAVGEGFIALGDLLRKAGEDEE